MIETWDYVKLLSIGMCAGILSGLFGVGGGVIVVPTLIFLYGYSQQTANSVSLVALLGPVGILGVWKYYSQGHLGPLQLKQGVLIAVGIFFGALIGSIFAISTPGPVLKKGFAVFLIAVALKLLSS